MLAGRGAGVDASEIGRIADRFLIEEMRRQSSVIGQSDALRRYHDLLQTMLGAPGDSQIGARQAALEQINHGLGEMQIFLEHQVGGIEDVDLAEAITRLNQDQMVLEATMATVARLSQLSLADFLR